MGTRDPRIDDYIDSSADFAKPILRYVREVVHAACPDVVETVKWRFPHFDYKGMMCSMAAFKEHCTLGFWNHELVVGGKRVEGATGSFGRITSLEELPSKKVLAGYVKKAMELRDAGTKPTRSPAKKRKKPEAVVPEDLAEALKKNKRAAEAFAAFGPSHRREYVDWITEAKRPETRAGRVATTVEWLLEGKHRNWKYQ
jgi:uncharacterized protein YdeI (YjbR/CyaY-like superfamily)